MESDKEKSNRKRKNVASGSTIGVQQHHLQQQQQQQEDQSLLDLSLSLSPPPNTQQSVIPNPTDIDPMLRTHVRRRINPPKAKPEGSKSVMIEAPYPWAKEQRAKVYSVKHLLDNGITTISGLVKCNKCMADSFTQHFNLQEKFLEVGTYIQTAQHGMYNRAPEKWQNPSFLPCGACKGENCCRPVISDKKRNINWLFMFLGEFIGCCTLNQLKYFCKHTKVHRTGAKDRLIYSTYFELLRQLKSD